MSNRKPRAWILESKKQPSLVRRVTREEPTPAQREMADIDGDVFVPLYECAHAETNARLTEAMLSAEEARDCLLEALREAFDTDLTYLGDMAMVPRQAVVMARLAIKGTAP